MGSEITLHTAPVNATASTTGFIVLDFSEATLLDPRELLNFPTTVGELTHTQQMLLTEGMALALRIIDNNPDTF